MTRSQATSEGESATYTEATQIEHRNGRIHPERSFRPAPAACQLHRQSVSQAVHSLLPSDLLTHSLSVIPFIAVPLANSVIPSITQKPIVVTVVMTVGYSQAILSFNHSITVLASISLPICSPNHTTQSKQLRSHSSIAQHRKYHTQQ